MGFVDGVECGECDVQLNRRLARKLLLEEKRRAVLARVVERMRERVESGSFGHNDLCDLTLAKVASDDKVECVDIELAEKLGVGALRRNFVS